MLFNYLLELMSLVWFSLLVTIPAVVLNRRADRCAQNLSPEDVLQRTLKEIDEVFAWYEGHISRDTANSIGCCYARYSTQYQDSIAAQIRKILEHALALQVYVPREFIFFDTAVTARKKRRNGLSRLEATLASKKCRTLLLFATNRLFRKKYATLEFADRVHRGLGIRIVFVAQHIDTNNTKQWEFLLHFHAMMDQFVVTMYADNIRAAHEGLLERRLVFGSISYGFGGEIIDGEFSPRGKPRRRLVIEEDAARVVRLIFHMFVNERQDLNEIARKLNGDASVALPPRCISGRWTNDVVRRVLINTRYRGLWRYGVCENVYVHDADYFRNKPRLEPLKEAQIEELRIVDDALWFAAAKLIAQNGHGHGGRKSTDGDQASRPKVLNGLLDCQAHERPLVVSGAYGRHMVCPVCQCIPAHKRSLTSWLNRAVALRLLCDELARRILADDSLVELVIQACRQAAEDHLRPNPKDESRLKLSLDKVKRGIEFILKSPGETDDDQADSMRVLRELRTEKARLEADLRAIHTARNEPPKVPTVKEVRKVLKDLAATLRSAGQSNDPADRAALRCIIEELIDGPIQMSQQGERKRQKGWLRGTFRIRLLSTVVHHVSNGVVKDGDDGVEVSIDFKRPLKTDEKAEIAWRMHQEKKRHADIAKELGCSKSYVTKLLRYYAEKHGVKWVDGRSLRDNFPPENRQPALFKRIADKVMEKFNADVPIGEIAALFDVHVATVSKSIRWWHERRKLPVPNGRTRAGRLRREANLRRNAT